MQIKTFLNKIIVIFSFLIIFTSCDEEIVEPKYLTENVIVIVIDGARYSETWGDTTHQYIPRLSKQLSKIGVINTNFYNNGPTYTLSGHTSITTGYYQEINNSGKETPQYPSFFQYWNKTSRNCEKYSWIITSKDKLEVLNNCLDTYFINNYNPSSDCGINGLGSGYRNDSITYDTLIEVLEKYNPNLVLVNFREPDYSAHSGDWEKYINGIISTDEFVFKIWCFIQRNDYYKDKTTLFITNDHGRHLDDVANGFISHGDECSGCRHILLYAYGPDFRRNVIIDNERELVDISTTIAKLLGFEMETSQGEVMYELFK